MTLEAEDIEQMKQGAALVAEAVAAASPGWPLNKRETMAAFILMGLTSRLLPVSATNTADRKRLVELGIQTADDALAALAKEPGK